MKYGNLNLGQIEALVNKVGGMQSVKRILSGFVNISTTLNAKPWITINLGNLKSSQRMFEALESAGYNQHEIKHFGTFDKYIDESDFEQESREVSLVVIDTDELSPGLGDTDSIYSAAKELGLDFCPIETAAQVLLQHPFSLDEFKTHQLQFASDPNKHDSEGIRIREEDGKNYLDRFTNTHTRPRNGEKFVFVLRK